MNSHFLQRAQAIQRALKSVIYCDKASVVLQKPPGLVCQLRNVSEGHGTPIGLKNENDLNFLTEALQQALGHRPVQVHRLDKGTTGALVLARSVNHARRLTQQFQIRTVEKTYLALVRGGGKSFPAKAGEIRASIKYEDGRASLDRSLGGESSFTEWELVDSSPVAPLSLLRLKLHTGHKHQLRIHLAHCLNTPILGDALYSRTPPSEAIQNVTIIPEDRIFLHASHLSFFQYKAAGPKKRFRLGITAPLPADFLRICRNAGLKVDTTEAQGGIFIDGNRVADGEIPELEGSWMPDLRPTL